VRRDESDARPIKWSQYVTLLHRCNVQKIHCRNDTLFFNHAAIHSASSTFKHESKQWGEILRSFPTNDRTDQLSGYRLTNEIQSMPVAEISLHWHPDQLRGPLPFRGHAEVRNVWNFTSITPYLSLLHYDKSHGQLYFSFIERARMKAMVVQSCSEGHNPTTGKK